MSGALRRQRGEGFDLDSDEDEQIAEGRRRKQREEARKRRLLLGDEKLGKFDGNQKKEAFLRAIEDRDEDEEMDVLDGKDRNEEEVVPDSQQSQGPTDGQPLAAVSGNALKRKPESESSQSDRPAKRLPAALRRTTNDAFRKPASLAEVKESVSFLIDEPGLMENIAHQSDSEDEAAEPRPETGERPSYSARRTPANPTAIVDRLLVSKTSTTASLTEFRDNNGTNLAFASLNRTFSSFKTPSLLRRATTNQSNTTGPTISTTGMPPPTLKRDASSSSSSMLTEDNGVRRGGSKKSSINYATREAERRAVVDKIDAKRLEDVKRIAGMRRSSGGGGLGSVGQWGGSGFE